MKRISASEASRSFSRVLDEAKRGAVAAEQETRRRGRRQHVVLMERRRQSFERATSTFQLIPLAAATATAAARVWSDLVDDRAAAGLLIAATALERGWRLDMCHFGRPAGLRVLRP
jgi:predicted nucleic acid-binding protein